MKQISLTALKQLKADEIRDGGCLEVTADGEHLAYLIVGAMEEMRGQITTRASMIDKARGKI